MITKIKPKLVLINLKKKFFEKIGFTFPQPNHLAQNFYFVQFAAAKLYKI